MKIKIRYDYQYQTVEVTEAECESMIRNDYEERLAAAADPSTVQPRTMQEIMDDRFNRPEYNSIHQYRANNTELDVCDFEGDAFIDHSIDVEADYERSEILHALREAMNELEPQQQDLVRRIFFNGERPADIAREYGILQSSISHRLTKIYGALRKNLQKGGESFALLDG